MPPRPHVVLAVAFVQVVEREPRVFPMLPCGQLARFQDDTRTGGH